MPRHIIGLIVPALALLASHAFLAAQTNLERVVNGAYTPSHDYDLVHQRIEVRNFDWDSTAFDGRVTTTLVSLRPRLDAVTLDMGRTLEVRSVTPACARAAGRPACAPLAFARPGDSLVIRLGRPAAFGDTVRFTIDYHGRIRQGYGLYFFEDDGRPHRPRQVYTGGGTDGNPRWLPTWGGPADKATWDLVATLPAKLTVVSNGRLVSDRLVARGQRTTHWRQEQPASTYLISFAAAPFVRVRDRWRDIPVDYYVYREDTALARPLFGLTPDVMETFSRLTGVRYPWPKYAQATVADFIGGMENVSATTLVDWLPDARAYRDRPWYRHSLIPHEVAHQWFGNLVTAENWANYWLNEGMAEFMPGQYWAARQGAHAGQEFYLAAYRQFLGSDARRRMPLATYNSNNVYAKGALVLDMLKTQLGPEPFWASIRRYLTRHAYGSATSDDLRQAVLDATGQSLHWFWDQWIYSAGFPAFAVAAAYDSTARALTLTVRQTQVDTAPADSGTTRFVTPLVFRAPLAVRVGTARGDVVSQVTIDRREQTIRIEDLPSEPTMVAFDDANGVVKTLAFDQPTPWLATLLERHPHLWPRAWAVEQLAARPGDSLAGSALARAARAADYALTRSQAASALGRFPAAAALPALEAAIRDTSAQVREAAVAALGAVGGERASNLARDAWTSDSSYQVRAAALLALVRVAAPRARDAVLQALATPSYRDAIQGAAAAAVVQHPDPGLVDALAAQVGVQPLVSLALSALAARGDAGARRAVLGAVGDDRAWVRGWMLDAIEQQLDRPAALALLREAKATLRGAESRASLSREIERLEREGRPPS
ncbi:MAG: HEAT repeat domain-containing protein [Gemmatimonadota bacterium]|nr:HEAT repeat domain-containing protein [Gemmatimonadota bacterium]